jgi:PKD repeat protein
VIWPFRRAKPVQAPHAVIIAPEFAEVGATVTFDGRFSKGDIKNYRFGLGDGVTSWGPGPMYAVHQFREPGTHIVSLVVIGPTGLVSEATHFLTVREP